MNHPNARSDRDTKTAWLGKSCAVRVAIALFVLALLVRLVPLGLYVTPDEPIWVLRSVRLLDAVTSGDLTLIPQTGHPGFTTMVIGAVGVQLTKWLQPTEAYGHLTYIRDIAWLAPESSPAFPHLAFFLNTCRTVVAATCASGIALIYVIGKQRLGERTSRLLSLCLALDPFIAGHSGLLHTDALQATFVILSVLFLLPRKSEQTHFISIAIAALFLALAGLTKTLGLLISPGLALVLLIWGQDTLWQRWLRIIFLALVSLIFMFFLFPPFWFEPLSTLQNIVEAVTYHQGAGLRNVFFAGRRHIDPGPFFYPVVLLFRMTVPVFIGLISGIWRKKRRQHFAVKWLLTVIALYILALTLASKKFDRYVLSVIPLLTIIACIQWQPYVKRWKNIILASLCLPWAVVALIPLYYANPLLGGPWLAKYVIPFGWGEGSGFAAQKLNDLFPEPENHIILTGDVPGVASLFKGQVKIKQASNAVCADGLISRTEPDFRGYISVEKVVVAGLHLTTIFTQTNNFPDGNYLIAGSVAGVDTETVAPQMNTPALQQWLEERFAGVPFTWIHTPECDPITEAQLTSLLCPTSGDNGICYCTPSRRVEGLPVDQCQFTQLNAKPMEYIVRVGTILDLIATSWEPVIQAPGTVDVDVRWFIHNPYERLLTYLTLRDDNGLIWAGGSTVLTSTQDWLNSTRTPGSLLDGQIHLPLSDALPPGSYTLTLGFSDNEDRSIGLTNPDGTFGGVHTNLGTVTITSAPVVQSEIILPLPMDISMAGLHIRAGSSLPEKLFAGDPLPFRLEVARMAQSLSESANWAILCDNIIISQGDLLDIPGKPEEWHLGHYYELRYAPRTDPAISDAACTVELMSGNDLLKQVGAFHIGARERIFSVPKTPQYLMNYEIGTFGGLIGIDLPQSVVAPKNSLSLTLYWQARDTAELNYTVFVHLADKDGKVWAQSDAPPAAGTAPTTTWLAGQIIVDNHRINLPDDIPTGEYTLYAGLYDAESGYKETLFNSIGERVSGDQIPIRKIVVNK